MRQLIAGWLLLGALPALAQHTIDFAVSTTTGDGRVVTTATWSTTPPADSCEATGAPEWAGEKPSAGSQELELTQSVTLNLTCTWPGSSIATATWVNPATNTDGSQYTDAKATVLRWRRNADPRAAEGATLQQLLQTFGSVRAVQLDPTWTMHTVTGLDEPGEWRFVAYACNQRDVCSEASNVAAKTIVGMVTAMESIGIVVNPVPSPITELEVQ